MEIREAREEDIPAIVNLLKLSLGETLMPKSEKYWRWKHMENPFGKSPVLVCSEGSKILGVRAFMRWEWSHQGRIFRAIRAVDTATHPSYMGKGIFKKLTLSLLDFCKENGDDFVFNTPNGQSKPGYLKMGWLEAGRLPIYMAIDRPLAMIMNAVRKNREANTLDEQDTIKYYLDHPGLKSLLEGHQRGLTNMITNITPHYLAWRYLAVPVAQYVVIGQSQGKDLNALIIGRIKRATLGSELRITDCFLKRGTDLQGLINRLEKLKKEKNIDFTTLSGTAPGHSEKILGSLKVKARIGPLVTVKPLSTLNLQILNNFNDWSPSLGDLELF